MSETLLHHCSHCDTDAGIDCASCKLASLTKQQQSTSRKPHATIDDDGYSISEQLTDKKQDHTILILVITAALLFALVVIFTKMME